MTTASINAKGLMNIQGLPDVLYCEIIAGVTLKLQVDTGSPVSIISSALYNAHFRHIKLEHSNLELRNYSNGLIKVYGMFTAGASFGTRHTTGTFHVTSGNPLVGLDVLRGLQMRLDIEKHTCHQLSVTGIQNPQQYTEMFPQLFKEGLGHVKDFVH
ncbi:unnamed protein product, partial [Ixodes hexagonus]